MSLQVIAAVGKIMSSMRGGRMIAGHILPTTNRSRAIVSWPNLTLGQHVLSIGEEELNHSNEALVFGD
jgi:hypothetical protein